MLSEGFVAEQAKPLSPPWEYENALPERAFGACGCPATVCPVALLRNLRHPAFMVVSLIIWLRGVALVALLAMALGVAGLGHRAPQQHDATVEAFLLSGFTMADLCGSAGSEGSGTVARCLACTATAHALIPAHACAVRNADMQVVAAVFAPRERRTAAAVQDPAHAPRAPPLA